MGDHLSIITLLVPPTWSDLSLPPSLPLSLPPSADLSLKLRASRCEECGSLATCSCLQCNGYYCSSCFSTTHMSTNSMRRHKALPITQLGDSGPTHCHTHPTHLLAYYCKDDAATCCSECCITGSHKGHEVVSITEMVSGNGI